MNNFEIIIILICKRHWQAYMAKMSQDRASHFSVEFNGSYNGAKN